MNKNQIKALINKTEELEKSIKFLDDELNNSNINKYKNIQCNLLNYSIVSSRKILISSVNLKRNNKVYFDCKITVNILSSQTINFYFIVDNLCLKKVSKNLSSGHHTINIEDSYLSLKNTPVKIELQVINEQEKLIYLESINLLINGIEDEFETYQYNGLISNENLLISILAHKRLFIGTKSLETSIFSIENLNFHSWAISHSLAFDPQNRIAYLLRVDLDGRLFYSNLNDKNEIYLTSCVQSVSSIYCNNILYVTYIKNKSCYTFEIENGTSSKHKKITNIRKPIINSRLYYNNFINKIYLILTDKNNSNYLLESINTNLTQGETLSSSFEISLTLAGGENEV